MRMLSLALLCGCGAAGQGSAQISGSDAFVVRSALYAQVQVTGRQADPNGRLPRGTLLGVFLFPQADACSQLGQLSLDANAELGAGPTAVTPWAQLSALSPGVGTLAPGPYMYIGGTPSGDLLAMPAGYAGSSSGTFYPTVARQDSGSEGSLLSLTRVGGNQPDGRVEGNFLLSFGAAGNFSAAYCPNLGPLIGAINAL